jgi:NADPH:quinone reductase-like Zn-dependent oxidoreductase
MLIVDSEGFQYQGILVDSWPIVIGCDASGTVVEVGEEVTKFKKGDGVFSCSRLGAPGRGTFQEYVRRPNYTLLQLKPTNN